MMILCYFYKNNKLIILFIFLKKEASLDASSPSLQGNPLHSEQSLVL